jgi:hypothetical protein
MEQNKNIENKKENELKENENDKNPKTINDDDINLLSGDNDIDVGIKPDVKQNDVKIQICSCSLSIILNCFNKK